MITSIQLGGFKTLKEVVWICMTPPKGEKRFPVKCSGLLAREKINLPFLTCSNYEPDRGLDLVVESYQSDLALSILDDHFKNIKLDSAKAAVLSIFPHKSNPEVLGNLLDVCGREGLEPLAIANSHSAISVVFPERNISDATSALFGPFRFGAYRTPSDWKLAQKGKEVLYKEVVASYQEKRPKVYYLERQDSQDLSHVKINHHDLSAVGKVFKGFARMGLSLNFLVSTSSQEKRETRLFFCLPEPSGKSCHAITRRLLPKAVTAEFSPVALFSMNGPHFGDRYGIASELFQALESVHVDLLALSCATASIMGVVPADQIDSTIQAIQGCFDVPTVINKNP
jgi:aspartokinase